ncbi:MAG TPA: acyltransferase [Desulfobacterales bacterium]|nr:acyltransferase [Desulfobacterales bacterium]
MNRIVNVERLRILAAFGIVWFHAGNVYGRSIGYAGLPIFMMIFCALIISTQSASTYSDYIKKKSLRLIKPWIFWSCIYLSLKLIKQIYYNEPFTNEFKRYVFFVGSAVHLWYLPYAFVISLLLFPLKKLSGKGHQFIVASLLAGAGFILIFLCRIAMVHLNIPVPFPQWTFALPAIPLGVTIGIMYSAGSNKNKHIFFTAMIATTILINIYGNISYDKILIPYSYAIILVCGAFTWSGKFDFISHEWASLCFGIYLIHPLVASVLSRSCMGQVNPYCMIVIVFLLSSVITLVLKKTPLKQFA